MKLVKKVFKNRFFIFITTALIFSVIGVSAATYFPSDDVTYDNTVSGLSSTDVQGAIDELYDVCSTPVTPLITVNDLIKNVVTVGDGLYKDEYENGKYFYKGGNPDNYITFNGEEWRILSINSNGTVKIIRSDSIGNRQFNNYGMNSWSSSSLKTYSNGTYYNSLTDKDKIASSSFSVGGIDDEFVGLSTIVNSENGSKWSGKVGLITVSEYIRANNDETCDNIYDHNSNNDICLNSNWIYNDNSSFWTLTPDDGSSGRRVYYIYHFIDACCDTNITDSHQVRPAVNLISSIKLRGLGTKENPYTIET